MSQYGFVLPTEIGAPELIRSLTNDAEDGSILVSKLITAGGLFDIEPAATRMALTRLSKTGIVISAERGNYKTGPQGQPIKAIVRRWSNALAGTKTWNTNWIAVSIGHLKRSDKKAHRKRIRALTIYGFKESGTGLWVRPDNLVSPICEIQTSLESIGLDSEALVFQLANAAPPQDWSQLWETKSMASSYNDALTCLSESTINIPNLSVSKAAKECFVLGRSVIRLINTDPLLPTEILDQSLLSRVIFAMKTYDKLGKACWKRFYSEID